MRKNIYTILVTAAFSFILATGCSSTPENTEPEVSTSQETLTVDNSLPDDESSHKETTNSNTIATTTPSEEISSSEESSANTNTETEITTAPNNNNNATNTGNKNNSSNSGSTNNNSGNNNNSNNNNNSSSNTSSNSGNVVGEKNSDKIQVSYGETAPTEAKKLAQTVVNKIISPGMSDFEKAKAIHDYMVTNIDYDYANYLKDTIPDDSYNVIGALKNKYAVCAGYAKSFKLLCELSGLECTYVVGDTARGSHAWNQVKIDGKWYNVDVTWDDPVNLDKAFDDHKFNRYSYFLISDELMNKDHKAHGTVHTCPSSLNSKAYEIGAPWEKNLYTYVKNETELSAVLKKVVSSNASSVSIRWDTNWLKVQDMSKTIKALMLEYAMNDFNVAKYSYFSVVNTSFCCSTFYFNLNNNKYTPIDKLCTADDIKELIVTLKKGTPDQTTVPMDNKLVNDNTFYEVAVWAFETHDVSVQFHETEIPINSTTKAIHVYVGKNNYHGSHHANEAYHAKTVADIKGILEKLHSTPDSFRVVYRYGDELGRLSSDKLDSYIKNNLAPAWAKEYCYENYDVSTNDFVCVTVITFYNSCHSSAGMNWEYSKAPTCIEGGTTILKCGKCGKITQSHKVEATGVHETYWIYENDGTKHLSCKHCTYTGPTLYQYGDVWGYYDNNAASQLFTSVNKARESATHYNIDPYGNLISIETPPQLTLDNALSEELKSVALQAAWLLMNSSGWSFDSNIAITSGERTVEYACSTLTTNSSHARNLLNNKYLTRVGVCCFYFDTDGTGNKMTPIWCIYYGE